MTSDPKKELHEKIVTLLKPVFDRVVVDPEFRERLEQTPLAVLDEIGVELDLQTRGELEGKRFSEFWAARRAHVEGPVQIRDLPPEQGEALDEQELEAVVGGLLLSSTYLRSPTPSFAPPYVPVGPVVADTNLSLDSNLSLDPTKKLP
jgi:hypothetical protein